MPSANLQGLRATSQQEEEQEDWNRHTEEPEEDVSGRSGFAYFFF
jgi:hypothetical protein